MKTIWTIFKKEIKEIFRDKKNLYMLFGVPLILMPLFLVGIFEITKIFAENQAKENIKIAFLNEDESVKNFILNNKQYSIIENIDKNNIEHYIKSDSVDIILRFEEYFNENIKSNKTGLITLYHKSEGFNEIHINSTHDVLNQYERLLLLERLDEQKIKEENINPIEVNKKDITSNREKTGKTIGGFLPYFLIIYAFMGAMMPAIELGASEKEKRTLETLLSTPANYFKILLGKFATVFSSSFLAALCTAIGLLIAMNMVNISEEVYSVLSSLLNTKTIILIMILLIPLSAFFAALALSISIYSKSFKEAQSFMSQMIMIVVIPAIIGMSLPLSLNIGNALIPIFNVVLSCKEIMAGTIDISLLIVVFISTLILSIMSVYLSSKLFKKESFIFRN